MNARCIVIEAIVTVNMLKRYCRRSVRIGGFTLSVPSVRAVVTRYRNWRYKSSPDFWRLF